MTDQPERLLSEALRAKAGGAPGGRAPRRVRPAPAPPLAARWILLIAALLGLATGSVIGLITLL